MPKIVDHEARRDEIIAAFLDIAAAQGVAATTSRAIATRLGIAAGALWHYFTNFDDVLSAAFQAVYERTNERIAESVADTRGVEALRRMFNEVLPLTSIAEEEARIVVSFWGRIASDPKLAAARAVVANEWREAQRHYLDQAVEDGELVAIDDMECMLDLLGSIASSSQVAWVTHSIDRERLERLVPGLLAPHLRR